MRTRSPRSALLFSIFLLTLAAGGCHRAEQAEILSVGPFEPEALEAGRQLIFRAGCTGCHAVEDPALTSLPKIGPNLGRVASKTDPGWAAKWIRAPRDFRSTTWMPHFFEAAGSDSARTAAEVRGVVSYLWDRSEKITYPAPPAGDAGRGGELFNAVGCTGCHLLEENADRQVLGGELYRLQGPNLVGAGSKVKGSWLYAWLKDPKQYDPETRMPNLRLSDRQAADLTAYLLNSRHSTYENLDPPQGDESARRELIAAYLEEETAPAAGYDAMSEGERDLYVGRRTIEKYACYGCHEIPGFESAGSPAAKLVARAGVEALKGFAGHADESGDTRGVPRYQLVESEFEALRSRLLVAAAGPHETGPEIDGRKLVTRLNCRGCHLIEGKGHAVAATIEDPGLLPPDLAPEGARVQTPWLEAYLADPSSERMRPWLTAQMPTFGLSEGEIATLIAYFASQKRETPAEVPSEPPAAASLAVGRQVFNLLQCGRCHPAGAAAAEALGGVSPSNLAPSLEIAHRRIRYGWLQDWIKDPQRLLPGTKMPTFFAQSEPGVFDSPFAGGIDAHMFAEPKAKMMEHFDSEEGLAAFLADADRVTAAMRDYIWVIHEEE